MCGSIREFGFRIPVVAKSDGTVVDGHLRLKAARKLGLSEVPVALADELTDAQVKAFRILANQSANWAKWDTELLNLELEDLQEMDFDLLLTGFDEDQLEALLPQEEEEDKDYDELDDTPELAEETVTEPGDVWICGEHRLICGSSDSVEVLASLMGDDRGDLVFTDPPYGVAIGDKNKLLNAKLGTKAIETNIANDTLPPDELYNLLVVCMANAREFSKADASYYVTSPQNGELGFMMLQMMKDAGLPVRHVIIWEKNEPAFSLGRLDYDYQHEIIFYTWTKKHHNYRAGEYRSTIWRYNKPNKADLHPTMKPVPLVENCLKDGTKEGDIVLDIFGGSGTTLIAAENLKRRARLVELEPRYCDVIVRRWQKLTNKVAVNEKTGTPFPF